MTNTVNDLSFVIQVPKEQDDLATLEKMAAELKKLRTTNQLLQEQLSVLLNTVETYKKVDVVRAEQINALNSAVDSRKQLDELQLRKEELLKMEISLYKARVSMLEADLKNAKKSKIKTQIISTLISVSLAYFAIK